MRIANCGIGDVPPHAGCLKRFKKPVVVASGPSAEEKLARAMGVPSRPRRRSRSRARSFDLLIGRKVCPPERRNR
jgi:hypothetical protein